MGIWHCLGHCCVVTGSKYFFYHSDLCVTAATPGSTEAVMQPWCAVEGLGMKAKARKCSGSQVTLVGRTWFLNRQRLCCIHCRSTKFILKRDGSKKSAFTKSFLLMNVLCILLHLQEHPAFYLAFHNLFVLSFLRLHRRRTSQYLHWCFSASAGAVGTHLVRLWQPDICAFI